MTSKTILTWIDLETTGLNPFNGRVLEVAFVFTDLELNTLASYEAIVPQDIEESIKMMNDYCQNMHTHNGLIAALKEEGDQNYDRSIDRIENDIIDIFEQLDPQMDGLVKFVAAGSNVIFDIKWLMRHMCHLVESLHHRREVDGPESFYSLDVRTYARGFPDLFPSSSETHRAMSDILESIEQHRLMLTMVNTKQSSSNYIRLSSCPGIVPPSINPPDGYSELGLPK